MRKLRVETMKSNRTMWLNPAQGFILPTSMSVWLMATGIPVMLTATASMLVVPALWWNATLLWLAGALGVTALFWTLSAYAWFHLRGWGVAIQEIEKTKRQGDAYTSKTPVPPEQKAPRTGRRRAGNK